MQVTIVIDMIKYKRDICTIAGTNASNKFIYQFIPVLIQDYILIILPIITLIKDQIRYTILYLNLKIDYLYDSICLNSLIVIALTIGAKTYNPKIWYSINKSNYNIILQLLEILL